MGRVCNKLKKKTELSVILMRALYRFARDYVRG